MSWYICSAHSNNICLHVYLFGGDGFQNLLKVFYVCDNLRMMAKITINTKRDE